ncbi:pumilio/RRM domain-containing protein [Pholiota molesta]|nr:pumilio/RRM domain-containing protein [Pholiota molesta]
MSLSASDNNGTYSRVPPSGKTPPPAPSAAFAKRARELQSAEALGGRYRPPALRALASGGSPPNDAAPSITIPGDGSTLPPTNYPPGFRRARAGTLPSNVQLAAQRFAATTTTDPLMDQLQRQTPVAPIPSLAAPARPGLRHAVTTHSTTPAVAPPVAPSAVTERHNRLRSGSLTLPTGGLSNAFGPSIFSSSWLSTTNSNASGFSVLDELRSVTSADSGADDFDVHTLDYLGLDDSHRPPPAATLSELRNQAQAAIAGNLANPARTRANTVSNPYRIRPSVTGSLLSTPAAEEEEEYFVDNYDIGYDRQQLGAYDIGNSQGDYGQSSYLAKNYKTTDHFANNRPRAISVGILDDPMRTLQRRATTSETHSYLSELQHPSANISISNSIGNPSSILKTEKLAPRSGVSPSVHFPTSGDLPIGRGASAYLLAPNTHNRSVSPKSEGPSTQLQTPTRSLWIGNLDSAVTSEQLIHVFAPYGAIESLRLLPEKECGFVNFVDQADAIRAKEDVLNRLGGNIGMPNGQTVRIGFGKADSAPSWAYIPWHYGAKSAGSNSGIGSMDAQLQSTPTRALWIGSIPSSTTPATILSVFSPYGPIESARVLTHKNCGFINFERLDDAVRARKALNGRDVLGSDVGAIRIGFAKVPVKNGQEGTGSPDENSTSVVAQGVGDLSVGATIHALRSIKGASTIPAEQQVLGGAVENYRSNLLLSMIASGMHNAPHTPDGSKPPGWTASVTEQQMILRELSGGNFRPPTMYYTTIPLVSERPHNRRWDAAKLRELRNIDQIAADFMDSEIVDLASDWLGNTVGVQKLFEKCSSGPRVAMLERICPHLAMIGIHKNGTWAAQKIIECVTSPDEVALIAQNLRAYAPPLLLDQFGNYVIQCCLRFGPPANEFIFDAIVDRMWEHEGLPRSPHITINQQRRIATAIILNSIPLATNPNGALLLTWLLDTSGFPSRYNLLAPRFTPHLSHLCTHKRCSIPRRSCLTDVLGDQVNGVAVVHKILTSPFIDHNAKQIYVEATKRVLIELKVIATQAYRRLIEEVGLPVPNFQPTYNNTLPPTGKNFGVPGLPSGYPSNDQGFASMMAALQMGGQNPQAGPPNPPQLHIDQSYNSGAPRRAPPNPAANAYTPTNDAYNPFSMRTPETGSPRQVNVRRMPGAPSNAPLHVPQSPYGNQSPILTHGGPLPNMNQIQSPFGGMPPQAVPPQLYQPYMYQPYQQNPPSNMGTFHA